ncbi:uncharacterized protein [Lepeophtheirus salmonis]|uniref:C1orf198 homolog n=1 Tax=Lepeophtheirus salmonis TaxID=72036 RepID=C1BT97_LEPSM|nr:uncharacterized protein C1orf198 homolog [Lepeophtheirus salmonis]ACO12250.1 C1orf198 homolog [Lepeophtheirus salmonis]
MSCSFGMVPLRSVEEYFGSMSSTSKRLMEDVSGVKSSYDSVWKELEDKEKEQILDESIVPPEVSLQYETPSPSQHTVFPRYKVKAGQKTVRVEVEGENNETSSYSYLDEHSAPFHWKTRSQQELRFESGRPLSLSSTELTENGLEKITSPPSKILAQRPRNTTKGNPSFAKPVGIPIVPSSPSSSRLSSSPESVKSSQPLLKNTSTDSLGPSPSNSGIVHRIVKPRIAPPPPPPSSSQKRPVSAPPKEEDKKVLLDELSSPLDENFKNFSINLSTDSIEIPKTGFDFLDNW